LVLYVNGNLQATKNYTQGAWTLSHLLLGNNQYFISPYNNKFSGKLDDICIYNRALTQAGMDSIYNANICYQTITVTDTLKMNLNITGFNPITFQNTVKIYPNPANDQLNIDFGNYATLSNYTLKITNTLGQTVYTTVINKQSTTIDLSTFSGKGIYSVLITDDNSNIIESKKIVLQ